MNNSELSAVARPGAELEHMVVTRVLREDMDDPDSAPVLDAAGEKIVVARELYNSRGELVATFGPDEDVSV